MIVYFQGTVFELWLEISMRCVLISRCCQVTREGTLVDSMYTYNIGSDIINPLNPCWTQKLFLGLFPSFACLTALSSLYNSMHSCNYCYSQEGQNSQRCIQSHPLTLCTVHNGSLLHSVPNAEVYDSYSILTYSIFRTVYT